METSVVISLVSCLFAGFSVIYARKSNKLSKKAIEISEKEYFSKLADFALVIEKGIQLIDNNNERNILIFEIKISNKSSTKNSLNATLELKLKDENNSTILINHNPDIVINRDIDIFNKNIKIDEKCILTKWLLFVQPRNVFEYKVEHYNIKISDVNNNSISQKSFIIKTETI